MPCSSVALYFMLPLYLFPDPFIPQPSLLFKIKNELSCSDSERRGSECVVYF